MSVAYDYVYDHSEHMSLFVHCTHNTYDYDKEGAPE